MARPTRGVTTIGHPSVDLCGAQVGGRIDDMASFSGAVGGRQADIAVGDERRVRRGDDAAAPRGDRDGGAEAHDGAARRPRCGCIGRPQAAWGGAPSGDLPKDSRHVALPAVGVVALARSLGAEAWQVASLAEREEALEASRARAVTRVIRVDTDAGPSTGAGGSWRDAAVPDVSARRQVEAACDHLEANSAAGAPASERP